MKKIIRARFHLMGLSLFFLFLAGGCSTITIAQPEVNLMALEVQDVTLSHVNLLADIRVFNPNADQVTIQEVDYTLHLNNIKIFKGKTITPYSIPAQEYGRFKFRLSSAYWDIIELFNQLSNAQEATFLMEGTLKVGENRLFAQRFSFSKSGEIPLDQGQMHQPRVP